MRVLLGICAFVLMIPVLLLIGVALGPAALVILFVAGIAMFVLWIGNLVSRYASHGRVPPPHR